MTTAVLADMEKRQIERDARLFELQMDAFWKRWAPDDKYEAAQFHAELSILIRQVYRDAQEPVLKHLTDLTRAFALPPLLTP